MATRTPDLYRVKVAFPVLIVSRHRELDKAVLQIDNGERLTMAGQSACCPAAPTIAASPSSFFCQNSLAFHAVSE